MAHEKVLLVTGGSRGIGAAVALKAAEQCWSVLINYVSNAQAAEAVAAKIRSLGGAAEIVHGDTGSEDGIAAIFRAVDERFGRLDGLVNNAGVVDQTARVTPVHTHDDLRVVLFGPDLAAEPREPHQLLAPAAHDRRSDYAGRAVAAELRRL